MTGVGVVVDTSVARQSGNVFTELELSAKCREVLRTIETAQLRVVISDDIRREWRTHASRYAWLWLTDMISRNKHIAVDPQRNAELRRAIHKLGEVDRNAALKDLLLIEAALDDGKRIVSRDNAMRRILHGIAGSLSEVGEVHWIGPDHSECIPWLANGAPDNPDIQLSKMI